MLILIIMGNGQKEEAIRSEGYWIYNTESFQYSALGAGWVEHIQSLLYFFL